MIKDGQDASAAVTNAAFISRTADSSTTGRVTLTNATDSNSGGQVTNAQRAINETFDAVGMTGEGDLTRKVYSSLNFVASGDSHKVAIGKLDAQAKAQTTASVAASQITGQLPFAQVSGTVPVAQGGTGSTTQNFVDLSSAQQISGAKTFVTSPIFSALTSAGVLVNNASGQVSSTSTLPITQGGTGSATQNFVDLSTAQTVGGTKTLSSNPILSAMTTAGVVTNTATGQLQTSASVPIAQGGTGQTAKAAAFDALSPNTTKGDVSVSSGSTNTRLPVGSDAQVLTADSTQTLGVKWATVSAANPNVSNATGTLPIANGGTGQTSAAPAFDALAPTTTQGDLVLRGTSTNQRLAIGTSGYVLSSSGTTASWAQVSVSSPTGTLPLANGGTGQTTKAAAFDGLSPLTTKGDVHGYNGSTNVRVPVGSNGQLLQSDSTNAAGVSWVTTNLTSVYALYTITSAQAVAANGVIKYANLIKDTNTAYSTSTGLLTIPTGAGGLWVTQIVTSTTGGQINYYIKRNATSIGYLTYGNAITTGSLAYPCVAGDTLGVYIDAAATIGASGPQGPVAQVLFYRLGS